MKKHSLIYTSLTAAFCVFLSFCAISCQQNDDFDIQRGEDGYITLRLSCSDMLPTYEDPMDKILGTRAATQKTDDEKTINSLHLFFFKADGSFATLKDPDDQINAPYVRFYPASNEQTIRIPKGCFIENKLTVVALANIQGQDPTLKAVFKTPSTPATAEGESFVRTLNVTNETDEYGAFTTKEIEINNLNDLKAWIYAPAERDRVRDLPVGGMPMMSDPVDIAETDQASLERIAMKAMMARVEVNIRLEPNQTSRDGRLPILKIDSYGVENMAATVPYTQPATTALAYGNIRETKTVEDPHEVAANTTGEDQVIRLVYYTYENIQGEHQKKSAYPDGVTEADKQRWKPIVAKENDIDDKATRIVINGEYTTHQNFTYKAKFSIYLGGNTTTDFSVKRNHCYTNNVVIHGLDYVRNEDNGEYTFDGRVNVKDENNPWYISVVNERKVDAHASVLPMDIYLVLREDPTIPHPEWTNVEVKVIDDATNELCDWIGFEMIDYPTGMIPYRKTNDYGKNAFVAGTGAQKYFYHNLITASYTDDGATTWTDNLTDSDNPKIYRKNKFGIQKEGSYRIQENNNGSSSYFINGSEVFNTNNAPSEYEYGDHIEGAYSRMRIYFYIDENVPTNDGIGTEDIPARHARVELIYKNSNNEERTRKIEIDQASLLFVDGTNGGDRTRMYIETYEEYLEHSDPLEYHESAEMFKGLQWGPTNRYITNSNNNYNSDANNTMWFHRGRYLTNYAITNWSELNMTDVYLYNAPNGISAENLYALNYCFGKNKRQSSKNSGETEGAVWTGGNGQWELPAIRDLEVALESYYSTFPEFQNYFYWSSAPAQKRGGLANLSYREDTDNARACKVYYNPTENNYTHANSNYQATYPTYNDNGVTREGGNAPRSTNTIRIRAAYKTTAQNNQY